MIWWNSSDMVKQ